MKNGEKGIFSLIICQLFCTFHFKKITNSKMICVKTDFEIQLFSSYGNQEKSDIRSCLYKKSLLENNECILPSCFSLRMLKLNQNCEVTNVCFWSCTHGVCLSHSATMSLFDRKVYYMKLYFQFMLVTLIISTLSILFMIISHSCMIRKAIKLIKDEASEIQESQNSNSEDFEDPEKEEIDIFGFPYKIERHTNPKIQKTDYLLDCGE